MNSTAVASSSSRHTPQGGAAGPARVAGHRSNRHTPSPNPPPLAPPGPLAVSVGAAPPQQAHAEQHQQHHSLHQHHHAAGLLQHQQQAAHLYQQPHPQHFHHFIHAQHHNQHVPHAPHQQHHHNQPQQQPPPSHHAPDLLQQHHAAALAAAAAGGYPMMAGPQLPPFPPQLLPHMYGGFQTPPLATAYYHHHHQYGYPGWFGTPLMPPTATAAAAAAASYAATALEPSARSSYGPQPSTLAAGQPANATQQQQEVADCQAQQQQQQQKPGTTVMYVTHHMHPRASGGTGAAGSRVVNSSDGNGSGSRTDSDPKRNTSDGTQGGPSHGTHGSSQQQQPTNSTVATSNFAQPTQGDDSGRTYGNGNSGTTGSGDKGSADNAVKGGGGGGYAPEATGGGGNGEAKARGGDRHQRVDRGPSGAAGAHHAGGPGHHQFAGTGAYAQPTVHQQYTQQKQGGPQRGATQHHQQGGQQPRAALDSPRTSASDTVYADVQASKPGPDADHFRRFLRSRNSEALSSLLRPKYPATLAHLEVLSFAASHNDEVERQRRSWENKSIPIPEGIYARYYVWQRYRHNPARRDLCMKHNGRSKTGEPYDRCLYGEKCKFLHECGFCRSREHGWFAVGRCAHRLRLQDELASLGLIHLQETSTSGSGGSTSPDDDSAGAAQSTTTFRSSRAAPLRRAVDRLDGVDNPPLPAQQQQLQQDGSAELLTPHEQQAMAPQSEQQALADHGGPNGRGVSRQQRAAQCGPRYERADEDAAVAVPVRLHRADASRHYDPHVASSESSSSGRLAARWYTAGLTQQDETLLRAAAQLLYPNTVLAPTGPGATEALASKSSAAGSTATSSAHHHHHHQHPAAAARGLHRSSASRHRPAALAVVDDESMLAGGIATALSPPPPGTATSARPQQPSRRDRAPQPSGPARESVSVTDSATGEEASASATGASAQMVASDAAIGDASSSQQLVTSSGPADVPTAAPLETVTVSSSSAVIAP